MGIFLRRCLSGLVVLGLLFVVSKTQADGGRSPEISKEQKQILLQWSRHWIEGVQDEVFELDPEFVNHDFVVTLFNRNGDIIARKKSQPDTDAVDFKDRLLTVLTSIKEQRKNFKAEGSTASHEQSVSDDSKHDDFLHFEWIPYRAQFSNFGIVGLFDNKVYEPHMTGLSYSLKDKTVEITPLETIKLNWNAKQVRSKLAQKIGVDPRLMPTIHDLEIEIFEVDHFGERFPDRAFVDYVRGRKFVVPGDVTPELIDERLKLIGGWYRNNFNRGEVTYQYFPEIDMEQDAQRTIVRSTMSIWILNKLAVYLNDDELKKIGKTAIAHYLENYFRIAESLKAGKILPRPTPLKNGYLVKNHWTSAGFVILAILERGDLDQYRKEIDLLFDWMLTYEKSNHTMWTEQAQNQYFMPGQFLLCVATLFEKTKDQKYRDVFDRVLTAYENQLYAMMHLGHDLYAPYAPAWFTMPLAKMYVITREDRYRDLVFAINDRVKNWYALNSRYQVYPDYDGLLAPKSGYFGNNSITAAALESLSHAAYVAKLAKDPERQSVYAEILPHTIAYLMRLQYTMDNLFWIKNKKRTLGGFATDLVNGHIWMDNVWHLTSAFMKIQTGELLNKSDEM